MYLHEISISKALLSQLITDIHGRKYGSIIFNSTKRDADKYQNNLCDFGDFECKILVAINFPKPLTELTYPVCVSFGLWLIRNFEFLEIK